jgi:hypothetical protein
MIRRDIGYQGIKMCNGFFIKKYINIKKIAYTSHLYNIVMSKTSQTYKKKCTHKRTQNEKGKGRKTPPK